MGNLTVGGTGKTPMVHYLIQILKDKNPGVISRGYGRITKGFLPITEESNAETVGDEPLMLAQENLGVSFFVSENRVSGYSKAVEINPEINCFIFDDVFQHRHIKPQFNILLSDYNRPFYEDYVLPYGRLREKRSGAKRADAVVVTKVPANLSESAKAEISKKIAQYSSFPVFFAEYIVNEPTNSLGKKLNSSEEIILISALANNQVFYNQQSQNYKIKEHFAFRDHFKISPQVLSEILTKHKGLKIVTTQKDMVKIKPLLSPDDEKRFFVPKVEVKMDNSFINYMKQRLSFV